MQVVNPASELDETTLKDIARITGGQYFRATDREGLEKIYRQTGRVGASHGGKPNRPSGNGDFSLALGCWFRVEPWAGGANPTE